MSARRPPRGRHNRRGVGAASAAITPITILGPVTVWLRSDLGITLNGGAVSAWADQSGNGNNFTQGTGSAQPTYNTTGGPNSTPSLLFDGTADFLDNTTLALPAPATTNVYMWFVWRQVTWTSGERLCQSPDLGVAAYVITQNTVTPDIAMFNAVTANTNTAMTVNAYRRLETLFSGSTSDYLKIGSTQTSGVSAGNNDPTANGLRLATTNGGTTFANIELCEVVIKIGTAPTTAQRTSLDGYAAGRYGGVVLT